MQTIDELVSLSFGQELSTDNWENHVYELGESCVYKEVRTEHQLPPTTKDYDMRHILQRYWCSDTHFKNLLHDIHVFKDELGHWFPDTHVGQRPAHFSDNPHATVMVQRKIVGELLKNVPGFTSPELQKLADTVNHLHTHVFKAPSDFHAGNVLIEKGTDNVYYFDPGTPSDWQYFLNAEKLQSVIELSLAEARSFVDFMTPIYHKHLQPLRIAE